MYTTADFLTRINNCSSTAIDIFIDKNQNTAFTINPFPIGLLDHDAQILILLNINTRNLKAYRPTKRLANDSTISEFPCWWVRHHGMARPQVVDGGTASDIEGSCE